MIERKRKEDQHYHGNDKILRFKLYFVSDNRNFEIVWIGYSCRMAEEYHRFIETN